MISAPGTQHLIHTGCLVMNHCHWYWVINQVHINKNKVYASFYSQACDFWEEFKYIGRASQMRVQDIACHFRRCKQKASFNKIFCVMCAPSTNLQPHKNNLGSSLCVTKQLLSKPISMKMTLGIKKNKLHPYAVETLLELWPWCM